MRMNFDTWEETEAALRVIHKLFIQLHDAKPKKDSPDEKLWEEELKEVRKWAIIVNNRRVLLNIERQRKLRMTMRLNEIKSSVQKLSDEMIDAAKAIGTVAELTPEVKAKVLQFLNRDESIIGMSEADLQSLLSQTKDKFALRIACKIAGVRLE